jgi:glycosyltransferase involved in cell wall biosynthesis
VPPSDPIQFADALVEATNELARGDIWHLRQAAARQRVAENFGLDRMVQAYRTVWNEAAFGCKENVKI